MTDQQTYTTTWGDALLSLARSIPTYGDGNLAVKLPPIMSESVVIPTARLLAMIDRLDPDAMRAYLRETSETQLDGIDAVAAGISRQIIAEREVPEADSPEDIDEPAVIELSDDIDTRLHVIERLAKILRAGTDAVEVCTLADWVIDR